jgi:hypothetical protein
MLSGYPDIWNFRIIQFLTLWSLTTLIVVVPHR